MRPGGHELRNIENMDGRKAGVFRLRRVNPREGGVRGSEIDADVHSCLY